MSKIQKLEKVLKNNSIFLICYHNAHKSKNNNKKSVTIIFFLRENGHFLLGDKMETLGDAF